MVASRRSTRQHRRDNAITHNRRAPLGTPSVSDIAQAQPKIQILSRPQEAPPPITITREISSQTVHAQQIGLPDPSISERSLASAAVLTPEMYSTLSGKYDRNISSAQDLRLPLHKSGRTTGQHESPASIAPVSLEEYVKIRPARGRLRSQSKTASIASDDRLSNYPYRADIEHIVEEPPEKPHEKTSFEEHKDLEQIFPYFPELPVSATATPPEDVNDRLCFRKLTHSNGDVSILRWSPEEKCFLYVGRLKEASVTMFAEFLQRVYNLDASSVNFPTRDQKTQEVQNRMPEMIRYFCETENPLAASESSSPVSQRISTTYRAESHTNIMTTTRHEPASPPQPSTRPSTPGSMFDVHPSMIGPGAMVFHMGRGLDGFGGPSDSAMDTSRPLPLPRADSEATGLRRTVLHDPFESATSTISREPKGPLYSHGMLYQTAQNYSTTSSPGPILPSKQVPFSSRTTLEPIGSHRPRPAPTRTTSFPVIGQRAEISALSDEALRASVPLVVQRTDGPYLTSIPGKKEVDIQTFWNSGRQAATRQKEFIHRHLAASGKLSDGDAQAAMSIFVPLYENLQWYTAQKSAAARQVAVTTARNALAPGAVTASPADKDYFAKFVPPPGWCIDRSLNLGTTGFGKAAMGEKKVQTFFGELEWVGAPERVGRDPRYRPLPKPMGAVEEMSFRQGLPRQVIGRGGLNGGKSAGIGAGLSVGMGRFA